MPRHLDLRHDSDEPRRRIRHDLADVILRVEAAVPAGVIGPFRGVVVLPADERLPAPPADRREERIFLDFDPPALIIGQVHVKPIELIERDQVDVLLYELLRHEMAGDVEMRAAPREAWPVLDLDFRHRPRHPHRRCRSEDVWRQQLAQRLDRVERPGRPMRANRDLPSRDRELIAFVAQPRERRVETQGDRPCCGARRAGDPQPITGGRRHPIR